MKEGFTRYMKNHQVHWWIFICHMVEMDSLVSHTLNDILVKNSSGAFLASDVIICQRHYHMRAEPELSFKFGEDSF